MLARCADHLSFRFAEGNGGFCTVYGFALEPARIRGLVRQKFVATTLVGLFKGHGRLPGHGTRV